MTSRADRWGWAAAAAAIAVIVAAWMDLSPLHQYHTSDSLIPVFSSLYRWTPFFWEQNRYGSLIPLLSLAIDAPFANLLFQVGLRLFAVAATFFLLARTVVPRPYWPAVGAITLGLWLAGKGIRAHAFMQMQPYGQAAALSLAGLALLERDASKGRIAAGLGLLLLGSWVSFTTVFWLFPLVLVRYRRRSLPLLVAVALAFGAGLLFSWLSVYRGSTAFAPASLQDWPRAWRTLAARSVDYLSPPLVLAGLGLLVLAVLLVRRPRGRLALSAGICLLAAGLSELVVVGTTLWAKGNGWSVRYVAMELLAVAMLAPALALVLLLEGRPERWQRTANALALLALLPVLALRYGPPSVDRARAALDAFGDGTGEILASGCTHLLGGYWRTWPAAFHAGMVRWERGERTPVWAVTIRSGPTRSLWWREDWTGARIAVLRGNEGAAEDARRLQGLPSLHLAEDLGDVRVYTAE